MPEDEDGLDEARRALYRLPPEEFLAARTDLVDATDDPALAKAVKALRKPTVAAWIVNAYVAAHPDTVDELVEVGRALAQAQTDLDTATMRELTVGRRSTVATVTAAAFDAAGRTDPPTTLRDEVSGTFDAAVADPSIAARLGMLQRPESWSGFGVAPSAAAGLTLVQGSGRKAARTKAAPEPDEPADEIADEEEDDHDEEEIDPDLVEAREALETAAAEADEARTAEEDLQTRLRRLTTRLSTLQHEITSVRSDLDAARAATTKARRARRTAQSDVDRLERRR